MNILVIFTGGSIGSSAAEDGYLSPDASKGYRLLDMYSQLSGEQVEFDTDEPFRMLSENMTAIHIATLIGCVKRHLEEGYDGIIVTHGTDTIQYMAAALGYALGNSCAPVVLVSSNYILDDSRSNGLANFASAADFISRGCDTGVFVAYRNYGEGVTIHRATRLMEHRAYSDQLYSIRNSWYGRFTNGVFEKNPDYQEFPDDTCCLDWENPEYGTRVLWIKPYVGMCYPQIPEKTQAVLLGSYHSGTVNTDSQELEAFAAEAYEKNIPIFLTGAEKGIGYESTKKFQQLGIQKLPVTAPVAAYVKLSMLLSQKKDPVNILPYSLGGDFPA